MSREKCFQRSANLHLIDVRLVHVIVTFARKIALCLVTSSNDIKFEQQHTIEFRL